MVKEVAIGVGLWLLFRKKKPEAAQAPEVARTDASPLEMEAAVAQVAAEQIRQDEAMKTGHYAKTLPVDQGPENVPYLEVDRHAEPAVEYPGKYAPEMTEMRRSMPRRSVCNTNVDCGDDQQYMESFPSTM